MRKKNTAWSWEVRDSSWDIKSYQNFHCPPRPHSYERSDGWGSATQLTDSKVVLFFFCCYPFNPSIYRTAFCFRSKKKKRQFHVGGTEQEGRLLSAAQQNRTTLALPLFRQWISAWCAVRHQDHDSLLFKHTFFSEVLTVQHLIRVYDNVDKREPSAPWRQIVGENECNWIKIKLPR